MLPRFQVEIPVIDDDAPSSLSQLALEVFGDLPIRRKGVATDIRALTTTDLAVFLAPEASQLEDIKTFSDSLNPKPIVIFNPKWNFEEESNFGDLSGFVGSFERKGVIFKCVRDGVLSGERWSVLVEEEGELKVILRFKSRPSIGEVETVLCNLMAMNSPITKSAKILRKLVSTVRIEFSTNGSVFDVPSLILRFLFEPIAPLQDFVAYLFKPVVVENVHSISPSTFIRIKILRYQRMRKVQVALEFLRHNKLILSSACFYCPINFSIQVDVP
ncbi:protein of unknown function DUF1995 [Dillenia turbinata]|uniref:DUF1995 domain-containing protein n=1 Tax=Dillenia turbinata TaxID=194707 RepID=A0AAN8ZHD9_9MAGN